MAEEIMDMMMVESIEFIVGGMRYEVNQSLLLQFPNTLLARAVSETWNQSGNSNNSSSTNGPILINRNGERFAYILDYMRDNRINLPITVSKEDIINDLNYYGFDNIDSIMITVTTIPGRGMLHHTKTIYTTHKRKLEQMEI